MVRGWIRRWGRRLATDQDGAALVEFALTAPIFLMLLIGILQVGILGMMSANFNAAVDAAARQVRTGQADGPKSAADFKAVICARMADSPTSCLSRLVVSVAQAKGGFTSAKLGKLPDKDAFETGTADSVMVVTATYKWPFFVPFADDAFPRADGEHVLIASAFAFKNEPYL